MGSKHSRPSSRQPSDGDAKPRQDDEISAEARAEFTVDDIHSPENTRRAQRLRSDDFDRFCKYRNYFKNHHMSLAREVGRKTSKSKAELRRWVEDAVGPLEGGDKFTKDEVLEIAMVSAALTEYGEATLAKMYAKGELDALPNVPLHTHNLRMPAKQQACRDSSDAANKDKLEAAHYIGLEVMLRLNERLPVEQRMGEELREILNHPSNLRLMLATSNQVLHKKVDAMLINAKDVPSPEATNTKMQQTRKISAREYDRLVQIAKHAQDEGFQDAMIAANGHYLYVSLRQQFDSLDVGERPKLWDAKKDKPELRQVTRDNTRSRSPTPEVPRTPPSPEKKRDPKPRMVQTSSPLSPTPDKKHRNPFSRLAAKLFHSHSKRKHAVTRSASTAAIRPPEQLSNNTGNITVQVHRPRTKNVTRKKTATKGNAKRAVGAPRKMSKSNQNDQPKLRRRGAKTTGHRSKQEIGDGSSADDSDYVDDDTDKEDTRVLYVGPRGGKYYFNSAGKKVYVK
ncbi:unnamed protein product [Phytophthora lilii]|uniref:Unnamed protein product n=1 Tax=Phytophthora lilii TaxID=2077276 RepID=A0A9W6YHW4_9STRA|nr:unnamed protein product [Phytophthora lilii]